MGPRASLIAPLVISTAGHAALLALLLLGARLSSLAPPIPIEVRPAHRAVERSGPVERRGDPKTADKPPKPIVKTPGAKAAKPTPPKPAPPPETTDLSPFAPDDAHFVILLCMDKLRRSPHRAGAETLLAAVPDWQTLIERSGVSPIDDFESLLIASANLHDVTATFFAARYNDGAKMRRMTSLTMPDGDPRVFRTLQPGLTILAQPAALAPSDMGDPRTTWLKQLAEFDRATQSPNGPAMLVTFTDVPGLLHFGDGLPTPQAMALAATGDASPAVRVRVVFANATEAQNFAAAWPRILQRYREATALFGLSRALDGFALDINDANVELTGRVPELQMRLLLNWVRALIPAHPAGATGPTPLDAGTTPK